MKKYILTLMFAAVLLAIPTSVAAIDDEANSNTRINAITTARTLKLEGKKLEICQKRQGLIEARMKKVTERGELHINTIGGLYEKLVGFYNSKKISFEDYDQIVADIALAKQQAQEQVQSALNLSSGFSCESNSPVDDVRQFNSVTKEQAKAMIEYKNQVKAFGARIRAALSTNKTENE